MKVKDNEIFDVSLEDRSTDSELDGKFDSIKIKSREKFFSRESNIYKASLSMTDLDLILILPRII